MKQPTVINDAPTKVILPPENLQFDYFHVHGNTMVVCDNNIRHGSLNKYGDAMLYRKNGNGDWELISTMGEQPLYKSCQTYPYHDGKTMVVQTQETTSSSTQQMSIYDISDNSFVYKRSLPYTSKSNT